MPSLKRTLTFLPLITRKEERDRITPCGRRRYWIAQNHRRGGGKKDPFRELSGSGRQWSSRSAHRRDDSRWTGLPWCCSALPARPFRRRRECQGGARRQSSAPASIRGTFWFALRRTVGG